MANVRTVYTARENQVIDQAVKEVTENYISLSDLTETADTSGEMVTVVGNKAYRLPASTLVSEALDGLDISYSKGKLTIKY